MKIKTIAVILLVFATQLASAQQPAATSKEACLARLDALFEEGRHCYVDLGNKAQLQNAIEAYREALAQGRNDRLITSEDEEYFLLTAKLEKMEGDYHYLNSDTDPSSFKQAESYFTNALSVASATQNQLTYYFQFVLHLELAQLYYKQERYAEALDQMKQAELYSTSLDDANEILDFLSQKAMCQARVGQFKEALDGINMVIDKYPDKTSEPYGEALRKKAKILMLQKENGGTGMADPTGEALKCYKAYFALKRTDALQRFDAMSNEEREQYWMRLRPFVVDCYRIEEADPSFLYDVTLFSKALLLELNRNGGGAQPLSEVVWKDIQGKLHKDECAVEFFQYEKSGKQKMAALVLKPTGEPRFVTMPAPDSVMNYKIGLMKVEDRLNTIETRTRKNKQAINALYNDSTGFFRYIWPSELIDAIGNAKQVWFAPDGYLHRIAIEYMRPEASSSFQCHRLNSTRLLMTRDDNAQKKSKSGTALLIGGVDYNSQTGSANLSNDTTAYSLLTDPFRYDNMRFVPLAASLAEVQEVQKIRNNAKDKMLVGEEASEQAFRRSCSDYSFIHISSHGLFNAPPVPLGTDLKPCLDDNSLSQSILAFSGANTNLLDLSFDRSHPDGVLSARELAAFDLSHTDLVVLSCCQTGLGYITADGVYGIQRGLKNAGVKAIVVTLWSIDDDASSFFMINLYQQLRKGLSIYDAFQTVRDMMTASEDFSDPVFRDPFLLIDAL